MLMRHNTRHVKAATNTGRVRRAVRGAADGLREGAGETAKPRGPGAAGAPARLWGPSQELRAPGFTRNDAEMMGARGAWMLAGVLRSWNHLHTAVARHLQAPNWRPYV